MTWRELLGGLGVLVGLKDTPTPDQYFAQGSVWTPVISSNHHSAAYLPHGLVSAGRGQMSGNGEMRIRFLNKKTGGVGREYRYFNVPEGVYLGYLSAPSKGIYFNANIRWVYAYQPV